MESLPSLDQRGDALPSPDDLDRQAVPAARVAVVSAPARLQPGQRSAPARAAQRHEGLRRRRCSASGRRSPSRTSRSRIDGEPPTIIAIVGESGSGKTTMARLLLGLETPTTGEVLYKGKDLRDSLRQERRAFRRDVQAIFQDPFGVYNSFYKVDHVLTTPIAKFKLAKSRAEARRHDRAGAAGGRAAPRRDARPLSRTS